MIRQLYLNPEIDGELYFQTSPDAIYHYSLAKWVKEDFVPESFKPVVVTDSPVPFWALDIIRQQHVNMLPELKPDHSRLLETMQIIQDSAVNKASFFTKHIRDLGLHYDDRLIYGEENQYMRLDSGLWQEPKQLGALLSYLGPQDLRSYCEIGTFQGWTFGIISSLLARFPFGGIHCTAVDPIEVLPEAVISGVNNLGAGVRYIKGTSDDIAGKKYDLVLIDGNHTYEWVKKDWENVGQHAKICLFHDINCAYLEHAERTNGVRQFWNEIQVTKIAITTPHPVMGIGVVVNGL